MLSMSYFRKTLFFTILVLGGTIVPTQVFAQQQGCTDVCEGPYPELEMPAYPDGMDDLDEYEWSDNTPDEGFSLGTHTVTWQLLALNDGDRVVSTIEQVIEIVDTTAPELDEYELVELPAQAYLTKITSELLGGAPRVSDAFDPNPSVTFLGLLDVITVETIAEEVFENVNSQEEADAASATMDAIINDLPTIFKVTTGLYYAKWQATDSSGNTSYLYQFVAVIPVATLLQSPTAVIGGEAKITIELNGKTLSDFYGPELGRENPNVAAQRNKKLNFAAKSGNIKDYPVAAFIVEFSGTVIDKIIDDAEEEDDYIEIDLEEGQTVGTAYFEIPDDIGITSSDTLFATIVDSYGDLEIGEQDSITIPLTDQNIAPRVDELKAYLNDNFCVSVKATGQISAKCSPERLYGTSFSKNNSYPVVIETNVIDEDDTTSVWEITGATEYSSDSEYLSFIPDQASANIVKVKLTVTDEGGLVTTKSIEVLLTSVNLPPLTADDTDGDGTSDADEGTGDSDGDGIADYLDNNPNVNQLPLGSDNDPMFVDSGITLTLGITKRSADTYGADDATVSDDDLINHGDEGEDAPNNTTDSDYPIENRISPVIDFEVKGFEVGETINIVIPLPDGVSIPNKAVYRKYTAAEGWNSFKSNANNAIASAPRNSNDSCPAVASNDYTSGLTTGDHCIRLSIEDGGPNDADLEANGVIVDPGVLTITNEVDSTTPVESPVSTTTTTTTTTTFTPGSSGGSTGLLLLLLLPLTIFRVRKLKEHSSQ
jgi:hypothetical protein